MKNMRDKRRCKILFERGMDQEEFGVFYDFEEANQSFLGGAATASAANEENEIIDEGEDDEWEDVLQSVTQWPCGPRTCDRRPLSVHVSRLRTTRVRFMRIEAQETTSDAS